MKQLDPSKEKCKLIEALQDSDFSEIKILTKP